MLADVVAIIGTQDIVFGDRPMSAGGLSLEVIAKIEAEAKKYPTSSRCGEICLAIRSSGTRLDYRYDWVGGVRPLGLAADRSI